MELHPIPIDSKHDSYLNHFPKQVWGKIYCQANKIHLEILDDGRGFDNGKIKAGNGLQNMRVRAERLYGTIEIKSSVNHGTTIKLSFPIATQ